MIVYKRCDSLKLNSFRIKINIIIVIIMLKIIVFLNFLLFKIKK